MERNAIAYPIDKVSPTLALRIAQAAQIPQVMNVTDLRSRHSGSDTFVDLTIELQRISLWTKLIKYLTKWKHPSRQ